MEEYKIKYEKWLNDDAISERQTRIKSNFRK